ncbi:MAG: zinc-ribbon domain-containing protein [Desulfuromonadales bacterium]|nr:zinc-ribbon domain-containing protein [Desulfuromonadales bacterium]MBN2792012.1 zinc-ribbon domain-containing protein [Desulfuromonadales bacterium]
MIIVCPECSTKFNVKAERIPDGGSRVRCARCQHVFYVEKSEELQPAEAVFEASPPVDQPEEQPLHANAEEAPLSGTEDSDFSYENFQHLDSPKADDEDFAFDAQPDDEDFSFSATPEETLSPIEKVFAAEDPEQELEHDDQDSAEADSVAAAFAPEQPEDTPSKPLSTHAETKKSSPLASIIRILLVLILALLVIGGVLVYMNGPDQLNQTIQQLLGQQTERPVQTGQISLDNLEGKFIQNELAGELFLIRGEAINNYSEPRAAIQVKGVIFDPNGKPLLQKTVFCGNPISEEDLQARSFEELEKIMGNQFGQNLSNMKVNQGQTIPFDIVFKDLPKNLSEFSVKVTASKPATK